VIRWLTLLLVILVLPAPKVGVSSVGAVPADACVCMRGSDPTPADWSVVDYDDDSDDDSVPPAPERSDEDLLSTSAAIAMARGDVLTAVRLFHDTGLRPARGHSRALELPPRSA